MLLATALVLGFLHGLGADHLMAIAALSVDGAVATPAARRTRALAVAIRFAVGHALLLGVGAALIVLAGWTIPAIVERGGEVLGGTLLVVIGAAFAISSLRALAALTPFGGRIGGAPLPLLAGLIAVFAVGILLAMSLFGVALARMLSAHALHRVGRAAAVLVAASSILLGAAWIFTA